MVKITQDKVEPSFYDLYKSYVEPSEDKGIKKAFYDLYNDPVFGKHTTNQSLQKKLERFRNKMAVDFYNFQSELPESLREGETVTDAKQLDIQINAFANKYTLWKTPQPLNILGKPIPSNVFDVLDYARVKEYLGMFRTITDKIIAKEELTEDEIQTINNWLYGRIIQGKKDSGGFILKKEYVPFHNFGMIRALYEWVVLVSQGQVEVERCKAPNCDKLFIPEKRGVEQIYCGATCKKRAFRHRKQLALNTLNT